MLYRREFLGAFSAGMAAVVDAVCGLASWPKAKLPAAPALADGWRCGRFLLTYAQQFNKLKIDGVTYRVAGVPAVTLRLTYEADDDQHFFAMTMRHGQSIDTFLRVKQWLLETLTPAMSREERMLVNAYEKYLRTGELELS